MGSNKGHFSLIASIDDPKSYSKKWYSYSLGEFLAYDSRVEMRTSEKNTKSRLGPMSRSFVWAGQMVLS